MTEQESLKSSLIPAKSGTFTKVKMDFPNSSDVLKICECLYFKSSIALQKESNKIIISKTSAENAFILAVSNDQRELICQVLGDKALHKEVKISVENSSFQDVLKRKCSLVENKIKEYVISASLGISINSMLCVPLFNTTEQDKVFSLLCVINKKSFSADDLETVTNWSKYLSPLLKRSWGCEEEHKIRRQSESLLQVVKTLVTQIHNVTLLLKEVMAEARNLTGAERCSLFLLDKEENELVAKVFDGDTMQESAQAGKELRIPATEGIAGHVALSGEILNISDAYSHPLFYRKVDEVTGFKTRNILCFPIKDDRGVIGVAELCNKVNGSHFTYFDEEIARNFSVYCALCIMHSLMWKKVKDAQSRSRLSNGLIIQSQVSEEEVTELTSQSFGVNAIDDNVRSFSFVPRLLSDTESAHTTVAMFEELGMTQMWKIRKHKLIRFVITVKQGYRDPPYHNWKHGFSVGHFSYLLLHNLKLMGNQLSHLQGLALFIACLGHDLDHRGTTSSFQVQSKSVLAALYSSEGSVLERHHFAQTMAILHADGCNILENLSEEEYTKCLDHIRNIILATDLAHHFRIIKDIHNVLKEGYNSFNTEHQNLLLCLIVTCCDLSDQTKDWANTKDIAKLIYREFFTQGDLEKAMGVKPPEMMDRQRARIPALQINFLQQVVLPVYQLLSDFFPELTHIVDTVKLHLKQWEHVDIVFSENYNSSVTQLEFLDDERIDAAALSV